MEHYHHHRLDVVGTRAECKDSFIFFFLPDFFLSMVAFFKLILESWKHTRNSRQHFFFFFFKFERITIFLLFLQRRFGWLVGIPRSFGYAIQSRTVGYFVKALWPSKYDFLCIYFWLGIICLASTYFLGLYCDIVRFRLLIEAYLFVCVCYAIKETKSVGMNRERKFLIDSPCSSIVDPPPLRWNEWQRWGGGLLSFLVCCALCVSLTAGNQPRRPIQPSPPQKRIDPAIKKLGTTKIGVNARESLAMDG